MLRKERLDIEERKGHETKENRVMRSFVIFTYSVIQQWLYRAMLGLELFFSFVIFFTQTVGLLGRYGTVG
jgi:hypothetical protein